MNFSGGTLLIVVGIVLLWLAATGRLSRLPDAWKALTTEGTTKPVTLDPSFNASPDLRRGLRVYS